MVIKSQQSTLSETSFSVVCIDVAISMHVPQIEEEEINRRPKMGILWWYKSVVSRQHKVRLPVYIYSTLCPNFKIKTEML